MNREPAVVPHRPVCNVNTWLQGSQDLLNCHLLDLELIDDRVYAVLHADSLVVDRLTDGYVHALHPSVRRHSSKGGAALRTEGTWRLSAGTVRAYR